MTYTIPCYEPGAFAECSDLISNGIDAVLVDDEGVPLPACLQPNPAAWRFLPPATTTNDCLPVWFTVQAC